MEKDKNLYMITVSDKSGIFGTKYYTYAKDILTVKRTKEYKKAWCEYLKTYKGNFDIVKIEE